MGKKKKGSKKSGKKGKAPGAAAIKNAGKYSYLQFCCTNFCRKKVVHFPFNVWSQTKEHKRGKNAVLADEGLIL